MSHFTVLVTGADVEAALAPFDENAERPYRIYLTRDQMIARERKTLADIVNGPSYQEFMQDPSGYAEKTSYNPYHVRGLATVAQKMLRTDDEIFEELTEHEPRRESLMHALIAPPEVGYSADFIDPEGNLWSTSDRQMDRWDWYVEGGRWDGGLPTTDGRHVNTCLKGELSMAETNPTWAILHEGNWLEKGKMGWFGLAAHEEEEAKWDAQWRKFVEALPNDTQLTLVDCHI